MSESGLRSTIGNRVYAKSVSGVRIPISPPVNPTPSGVLLRHGSSSGLVQIEHRSLYQKRSRERFLLTNSATHLVVRSGTWKGGRAAECGGLENRFASNRGNEGSNPSPSASGCGLPSGSLFDSWGHGFLHSWKVHYALKQAEHTCSTACSPMKTHV